jgi:hypothetical protein
MLVYCEDRSHCANPVGPILTDPDPALPDDVYFAAEFHRWADGSPHWSINRYGARAAGKDGQLREVLADGTVLPPKVRQTKAQQLSSASPDRRDKWNPICRAKTANGRRCGQRGGRWTVEGRDEVLTALAEGGVTGVSLRKLELINTARY